MRSCVGLLASLEVRMGVIVLFNHGRAAFLIYIPVFLCLEEIQFTHAPLAPNPAITDQSDATPILPLSPPPRGCPACPLATNNHCRSSRLRLLCSPQKLLYNSTQKYPASTCLSCTLCYPKTHSCRTPPVIAPADCLPPGLDDVASDDG